MAKRIILSIMVLFLLLFAVSCSAPSSYKDGSNPSESDVEKPADEIISGDTGDRKIIITAQYTIEAKNFKETVKAFTGKVTEIGGYIESSDISQDKANFTFRIPADKLDAFFAFTENAGKVLYSSQKGKDVTIEYYDTQSELKALKVQEERLLALLETASSLDNILTLEKQLAEVRKSIEKITTRLNELDNLIEYATVTIRISEQGETEKDDSFGALITGSFNSSIRFGYTVFKYLCAALVWLLPYIAIVALLLFLIVFIRRKKRKKFEKDNL